jgi:hypothetical protein
MGRNVLVVSTVEGVADRLRDQLGDDVDQVKVVVPAVRQGVLDWLANDERAFSAAQAEAERTADELPGESVDPRAGEADVGLAIQDALATFPADEIVVAVHAEDASTPPEAAAAEATAAPDVAGVPVRTVVVHD